MYRTPNTTPEQEVLEAENQLRDAMLRSDTVKLESLIDARLLFVGPNGGLLSRSDDLRLYQSGEQQIRMLEVEDQRIEIRSDLAVATVVATMAGTFRGQDFAGRFRYLRTWHRTEGRWQVVAGCVVQLHLPTGS